MNKNYFYYQAIILLLQIYRINFIYRIYYFMEFEFKRKKTILNIYI